MFLKATKDGVPGKQMMVSLNYSVNKSLAQLGIEPHLLVPISMPEAQEWPSLTHLLFSDLHLPAFILLTLYLPTLLTSMHNKNVSFSGREKSVGVTPGWNISDFQILISFITGIFNFLPGNPRKWGIFSWNSSPFLTSLVQDVVGVEDWDTSAPFKEKSLALGDKRQVDGA